MSTSIWGTADSLRIMTDRLSDPAIRGNPEKLAGQLQLAILHMQGAADRLDVRASAQRRADERMERELAKLHRVDIDNGFDPRGCYVYVLWGSSDVTPLYVGRSTNVLARLGDHLGDSTKRSEIERVRLVRCKNAKTMAETELRMIAQFQPPWNKVGLNGPWKEWADSRND